MNNKLKSLLYLSCFLIASVIYHISDYEDIVKEIPETQEIVNADIIINPYTEAMDNQKTE
ncbi:hypothetical protein [Maribacter sp. 2304DJ31-5]|uniref:hypothetical protein n=1 Tax=Maribacter sp. 2304DJ31-5 TaxID=3386273 RepID=UPI0039BC21F5